MKLFAFLIVFLLPLNAMSDNLPTLDNLEPLTWKNRIILVFSSKTDQYQTMLERATAGIDDRDIVWFIIDGNKTTTNYQGKITDELAMNIGRAYSAIGAPVILIGKDGGVKETGDLLSLQGLFDEIDSMPMRIREMNQNQQTDG